MSKVATTMTTPATPAAGDGLRILTEADVNIEFGRLRQLIEVLNDEVMNIYGADGDALQEQLVRIEALASACLVYARSIDAYFDAEGGE